jgi:16S rRNA (uracil1498-N3)-methyltransferase
MNLFFSEKIEGEIAFFSEEESQHIRHALRKKTGDIIYFTDGAGYCYSGQLFHEAKAVQVIIKSKEKKQRPAYSLSLCIAPLKQPERLEWIIEKAVELGVFEINLVQTQHTERPNIKVERLRRLAIAALKQSLQFYLPSISAVQPFSDLILQPFEGSKAIAWCGDSFPKQHLAMTINPEKSLKLLIGPEGDFSENEVKQAMEVGYSVVHLGHTRLRTETAAIYSSCMYKTAVETALYQK